MVFASIGVGLLKQDLKLEHSNAREAWEACLAWCGVALDAQGREVFGAKAPNLVIFIFFHQSC